MADSETAVILEKIAAKSKVTMTSGVFVSYDATGCLVDVGGGRLPLQFATSYLPEAGETVLVQFIDGIPYVMGPTTPKPHTGTVTAIASNKVTLDTPVGSIADVPYVGSAPAVGQVMRIFWNAGPLAFTATPPPAPTPPPDPGNTGGGVSTHVDTFYATAAGTWNTGGGDSATSFFNSEVWASNTTIGLWFYGTKVKDTLPANAQPVRLQLYVAARQLQGSAPRFTLHGYPDPGPPPALAGGQEVGVGNYTWIDLPAVWITDLRRGGGAYGVGTRHGGYNIFKSLAADGQSGALRVTSVY